MGCQFGVPGGIYPTQKYPSAPPPPTPGPLTDSMKCIIQHDDFEAVCLTRAMHVKNHPRSDQTPRAGDREFQRVTTGSPSSKYEHRCVTFDIYGFVWEKPCRFCNLRK